MGKGIAYPKGRPTLGVLPVWHIAYTDIEELKTVTKERRVVYEVTQAQVEQNALLPHLPVLSEMAQLFYLASDPRLVSFPQAIYPHECWWVYGIGECLITLKPKYVDEVAFIADLKELNGGLVAFKLPEFNPAVSLSYI